MTKRVQEPLGLGKYLEGVLTTWARQAYNQIISLSSLVSQGLKTLIKAEFSTDPDASGSMVKGT